jgi:predicted O-methyltransferase YrrM
MDDSFRLNPPPALADIGRLASELSFDMACDERTGGLLRTLVAARPGGRFLELGTGVGTSTAWILQGMTPDSSLITVDNGSDWIAVARQVLGTDSRVTFVEADGGEFLKSLQGQAFDLIFADTWPGKYWQLDDAFALLAPGGLYVIDDMLPQANWPEGHDLKVAHLIDHLETRADLVITKLAWSSGLILVTKRWLRQ